MYTKLPIQTDVDHAAFRESGPTMIVLDLEKNPAMATALREALEYPQIILRATPASESVMVAGNKPKEKELTLLLASDQFLQFPKSFNISERAALQVRQGWLDHVLWPSMLIGMMVSLFSEGIGVLQPLIPGVCVAIFVFAICALRLGIRIQMFEKNVTPRA